ncbi:DUF2071 domain-containing protein [Aquimarina muelleri]|uniref:DUF2071 domain-containing protein n=1 Tax=Aquimarina muelleri TaxID=279356 RepID=A0A918JYG4_9FLAO|nr:DUF2071 domain-containing protein [Aquimarina muelleri]MCX2764827.1 DUF2071 domain-containing protein [Aquimarina muelleri]GGX27930.1 hypothetical protein GCM10007384_31460 [Aquimarina muelleri]
MKIPKIKGIMDRRILINYQVDKEVLENYLPKPFTPKLINGKGIAGICLIRLKEIRPKGFPKQIGISSENGAHRIAVEWNENGKLKEGVYIPRRDSSSKLNSFAGGAIFPGIHHLAKFTVSESNGNYNVAFISNDETYLSIEASETNNWNKESVFENLNCVSDFFENGAIGYSPDKNDFEGLELITHHWKVSLLEVKKVESSFFENTDIFPKGSVKFDNALLMTDIKHEWRKLKKIKSP